MKKIKFSNLKTISKYNADEVLSSLQKEIRRGKLENACFFGLELLETKGVFIDKFWERMLVISVEDVNDKNVITEIRSLKENYYELINAKEWDKNMQALKAIQILCESKKDRIISEIYDYLMIKRKEKLKIAIPSYALDMHTKIGKEKNKNYQHFLEVSSKIKNKKTNKNNKYKNELIKYAKKGIKP